MRKHIRVLTAILASIAKIVRNFDYSVLDAYIARVDHAWDGIGLWKKGGIHAKGVDYSNPKKLEYADLTSVVEYYYC